MLFFNVPSATTINGGYPVKAVAAFNPTVITVQRKDFQFTSITNSSGKMCLNIPAGGVPAIPFGSTVSVVISNNPQKHTVFASTGTTIVLNTSYSATAVGFVNLMDYYRGHYIECASFIKDEVGVYQPHIVSRHHASSAGYADIDLQEHLQSALSPQNTFSFNSQFYPETFLSKEMRFDFSEKGYLVSSDPVSEKLTSVYAAMQIGHSAGSFMKEYQITDENQPAQFLTTARKLRHWQGLPFQLCGFLNKNIVRSNYLLINRNRRIDGSLSGTSSMSITGASIVINETVYSFSVFGAVPANNYTYNTDIASIDLVMQNNAGQNVTEVMTIRLHQCIPTAPVYLQALNSQGGYNYYCFTGRSVRGINTQGNGALSSYLKSIALQTGDSIVSSKTNTPELSVGGNLLDTHDVDIMETIMTSPDVRILTNPYTWDNPGAAPGSIEGPKWHNVRIKSGTYKTRILNNTYQNVEFGLELPKINTQRL